MIVGGMLCCKRRILHLFSEPLLGPSFFSKFSDIYSIENAIEMIDAKPRDYVHIIRFNIADRMFHHNYGGRVEFDVDVWNRTRDASKHVTSLGWSQTVGTTLKKDGKCIDEKNWMKDCAGIDRVDQITSVLFALSSSLNSTLNMLANVKYTETYFGENLC